MFLAKMTLLEKDDQYGHQPPPQLGRTDGLHLQTGWSNQPVLTNGSAPTLHAGSSFVQCIVKHYGLDDFEKK